MSHVLDTENPLNTHASPRKVIEDERKNMVRSTFLESHSRHIQSLTECGLTGYRPVILTRPDSRSQADPPCQIADTGSRSYASPKSCRSGAALGAGGRRQATIGIVDQRSMPTEFAQGDHGDSSTFLLVDQRRHGQARSRQDLRPLRMIVRHTSSPEDPGELGLASAHLSRSRIWCANSWYVTSTWTSGRSTRWRSARREARQVRAKASSPLFD